MWTNQAPKYNSDLQVASAVKDISLLLQQGRDNASTDKLQSKGKPREAINQQCYFENCSMLVDT